MSVRALLSKSIVTEIHREAVSRFGGSHGIRDEGILDASLSQPWQAFEGTELYPGDVAKVCRLTYGIITNHPFLDGNKRTGAAVLGAGLRLCGYRFSPDPDDFLNAMFGVAQGMMGFEELVAWVRVNVEPEMKR